MVTQENIKNQFKKNFNYKTYFVFSKNLSMRNLPKMTEKKY